MLSLLLSTYDLHIQVTMSDLIALELLELVVPLTVAILLRHGAQGLGDHGAKQDFVIVDETTEQCLALRLLNISQQKIQICIRERDRRRVQ
jgi:hypothetical protein